MKNSRRMPFSLVSLSVLILSFINLSYAKTHTFNWTASWINANPDGVKERRVIACNGEWPWPTLEVNKGDRIILNLTNGLGDQTTSLHFHGLFQNGTNQMDGPEMVTQCPISPGSSFLYDFTFQQAGTYWYHSHTSGQYPDGFRGPLIIHEDDHPYTDAYSEETVLTVSDWYHQETDVLQKHFMSIYNPTGAEPIPQNLLFNDSSNVTWNIKPDTTYLVHLINLGGFVSQYFWIQDHELTVVEVDGVYVKPNTTNMLYLTTGQRYAFLLTTKSSSDKNYNIVTHYDSGMLDITYDDMVFTTSNWLVYNPDAELPSPPEIDNDKDEPNFEYLDDFYLQPLDEEELLPDADYTITVDVTMDNLINGVNYAFFNNLTYVAPKVPTLTTVMTSGELADQATIYGSNTNTFVLNPNEVIDIVINNKDAGTHPFHLHGHVFQLIERSDEEEPVIFDPSNHKERPQVPLKRDTVFVNGDGYAVLRFRADNPGVWFFHCHIDWHMIQGLALTIVESPLEIQKQNKLTDNYNKVCEDSKIATSGNAAGNSKEFLDLRGENVQPAIIRGVFTLKGYIAITIATLFGLAGITSIAIYGFSSLDPEEEFVYQIPGETTSTVFEDLDEYQEEETSSSTLLQEQQPSDH